MKKIFNFGLSIAGLIILMLAVIVPDVVGAGGATTAMAMFITKSFTWGGKETYDYFLKPSFIGKSPWETQGIKIRDNIQSSEKLNYFGAAANILKAYAKGFTAATGVTLTQRTLTVTRLKGEIADDASAFYQTVYESLLNKNDWNNLDSTVLKPIIMNIYKDALMRDVYRIFWLADPYKELLTSTTYGTQSGVADTNYNQLVGMWKLIFDNAATSPTSAQIKRIAVADGAAAQIQTVTMSVDASGSGNIAIDGVNYLSTRDTDATTTFNAFRTAYGTALGLRGFTLSGTTTLIVTSSIPGQPFAAITFTSVSGTYACTIAATLANTAPSALSAGEAEDTFLSMFEAQSEAMLAEPDSNKVLLVSRPLFQNYQTYLETLSTVVSNTKLENGVSMLTYRGIPVIPMDWGLYLNSNFPHAATYLPAYPHRAILTVNGNLVMGMDALSQYNNIDSWYNKDEEENRFRAKLTLGAQYVHNELMVVAY